MERLVTLSLETVFAAMASGQRKIKVDNHAVSVGSDRLVLFYQSGVKCVRCELVGDFFALERHTTETPHLNLYGVNDRGVEVLFTKDHILPKSLGGANHLANYQTMCQPCNGKKANKREA